MKIEGGSAAAAASGAGGGGRKGGDGGDKKAPRDRVGSGRVERVRGGRGKGKGKKGLCLHCERPGHQLGCILSLLYSHSILTGHHYRPTAGIGVCNVTRRNILQIEVRERRLVVARKYQRGAISVTL